MKQYGCTLLLQRLQRLLLIPTYVLLRKIAELKEEGNSSSAAGGVRNGGGGGNNKRVLPTVSVSAPPKAEGDDFKPDTSSSSSSIPVSLGSDDEAVAWVNTCLRALWQSGPTRRDMVDR